MGADNRITGKLGKIYTSKVKRPLRDSRASDKQQVSKTAKKAQAKRRAK